MKHFALLGLVALAATPVQATTITDHFTSFYVLGDSLSDNKNTAVMVGNLIAQQPDPASIDLVPSPPQQQPGVSSNGFTWAKEFTDAFAAAGKDTANLSFGAARAKDDGGGPPDLLAQISADASFTTTFVLPTVSSGPVPISGTAPKYADGKGGLLDPLRPKGSNALVAVFIGGNDFLDAAVDLTFGAVSQQTLVDDTLGAVKTAIDGLIVEGIDDFVVMNLPNFAVIPQFAGSAQPFGLNLAAAAVQYNSALDTYLDSLSGIARITTVDVFSALTDTSLLASAGITDTSTTCVSVTTDTSRDCTGLLYFDTIHPTAAGHGLIADLTRNRIAQEYAQPVPLPAPALMLLTALGGMLVVRRRKAA